MIRSAFARVALAFATCITVGCGGGTTSAATGADATAPAPRRDRTVITAEELKDVSVLNLYEAVQRIHPEWLVARNQATQTRSNATTASGQAGVQVYMDTQRLGNVEMLRQISISAVASLKYYSSSEAQSRFGLGNSSGAIQIISTTTKK